MTEKQRNLLLKYLTEDRVKKMEKMDFKVASKFIEMILSFRWYHPVAGEMCNIPYLKRKPTKTEVDKVHATIMENRSRLGLLTDEDVWVKEVRFLPNGKKWFWVEQTWFKGMANSPSHRSGCVSDNGYEKFDGMYNLLFDSGIYSIDGIVQLYANALQEHVDENAQ